MHTVYHVENFFDRKRAELIATLFSNNVSKAEKIYTEIHEQINNCGDLAENEQKAINQIQTFISKFKNNGLTTEILKSNKKIRKKLSHIVRKETKSVRQIDFNFWNINLGLNENQLEILFKTTSILQISSGCSNYCRRCNEWALPGIRSHFTFNAVKQFSKNIFNSGNNDFIFYGASDPLDWKDGNNNICDINNFLKKNNYYPSYGLLTKLPAGKATIMEQLIQQNYDLSISLTNKNRKRVESIETKTGKILSKQHDVGDLLIPAGLDEDFISVKSSITDSYGSEITPDGAFIVIPAFTSVLNLTGQRRIPVTKNTTYFIAKKTGREALPVSYFKPFEAIDLNGKLFQLNDLLDVQVENIILDNGNETINPPGMMNLDEFFKTFETEAVSRKKNILPSIIKQFKKKYLKDQSYKTATLNTKKRYRENLKNYLTLCNTTKMKNLKKFAFSFLLGAVATYLKSNPVNRRIIIHLKRNEKITLKKNYPDIFKATEITPFFEISDLNHFDLFQVLTLRLIESPDDLIIDNFTQNHPAVYDASADMFVGSPA